MKKHSERTSRALITGLASGLQKKKSLILEYSLWLVTGSFNKKLFLSFLFIGSFLLSAFPVQAVDSGPDSLSWDFRKPGSSNEWKISGARQIRSTSKGLKISGENFIQLLVPQGALIPADELNLLEVRVRVSEVFGTLSLAWLPVGIKGAKSKEMTMTLKNTGRFETVRIDMARYPEWSGELDQVLFGFYSDDGRVELESVRFYPRTLLKSLQFAWSEFTHPEYFRPLSINVISGPNLFGRKWIAWNYLFMAIGVAFILAWSFFSVRKIPARENIKKIFFLLTALWMVFDVRFSYDMALSLKSLEKRAASENRKPFFALGDRLEYVKFCEENLPQDAALGYYAKDDTFFPWIKYSLYPRKVLYAGRKGDYFLVYHNPALSVFKGQLIQKTKEGNNIIAAKGRRRASFDSDSFIFKKE